VIADVGMASISLFSVIVAIFLGSSLLYKEIDRKTLYVILPKPIRRGEFLLGKYFGIFLTAAVFVALMGAVQLWTAAVQAGVNLKLAAAALLGLPLILGLWMWRARDRTAVLIPFSALALGACSWLLLQVDRPLQPVLAQLALCAVEVLVLSAVAILFSAFSTPFLTGIFTLGIWVAGRAADDMATMKSKQLSDTVKGILRVAAEILPNFQLFVPGRNLLYGEGNIHVWQYVATSTGYGMLYAALLLSFAVFIFGRRDFI
jgi:ABC-type transport system involved in multi-copper enzyme maturation permease subunit